MNKTSKRLLLELGLSPASVCFWYALAAMEIVRQDPQSLTCLSKCVYPKLATSFDVTPEAVESGLRCAIGICWESNRARLEELVGVECKKPPTIRQILSAVVMDRE